MTPEQQALLITALSPIALGVLTGIGWVIRHLLTREQSADQPVITQGQTIPTTALPDWLERELDETQAREQAYRDHIIRRGDDPHEVLVAAGLTD